MILPRIDGQLVWVFGLLWAATVVGCQQSDRLSESLEDGSVQSTEDHSTDRFITETTEDEPEPSLSTPPSQPLRVCDYREVFHAKQFMEDLALSSVTDENRIQVTFGGEASHESELPYDQLQQKCRKTLEADGWVQDTIRVIPIGEEAKYEELFFTKNGRYVSITTMGPRSGKVDLKVKSLGNVDMRSLPAAKSFETDDNATYTYGSYVTDDEIDVAADFCRESMTEQGWKTFSCIGEPSCLPNAQSPNQVIAFCKAGFTCYATINRTPGYKEGRTTVNYIATGIMPVDLLVLPDGDDLELDVLYGKASYHSKQDAKAIRKAVSDFYSELDFPLIDSGGKTAFVDIYRSGEGEQILVDITPSDDGRTSVQLIRQFEKADSAR